jgi:Ca-activated chloride channel family protein
VLDRSGSMRGQPIAQARNALRACLRTLNPDDLFHILFFDNKLEWFRRKASEVTQRTIDAADDYLDKVSARGGTAIVEALKAALALPADPERTRYVVFLTDGAVSAEERALNEVRRDLGNTRVFTFGIGPSVNRALLSKLATLGRGTAEFLGLQEDIEGAIIRFQDRVSFPALTDLTLEWKNGKSWDVYPTRLPDLYVGQPLAIAGRLKRNGRTTLTVKGRRAGAGASDSVEMTVTFPAESDREPIVVRAWARARVDDLLEGTAMRGSEVHKLRAEIIGLALEHGLVTPYTAFVAVDSEIAVEDGQARPIHVSQPLPQGLDIEGFIGTRAMRGMGMAMSLSAPMPPAAYAMPAAAPAPRSGGLLRGIVGRKRRKARADDLVDIAKTPAMPAAEEYVSASGDVQGTLRWLARTQNVNGSWNDDVELTAAALLAFVRAGHTTRDGHYRQGVKRAFEWLRGARRGGFAAFARALALVELAAATGSKRHLQAAQAAIGELAAPKSELERAALARANAPGTTPPGAPGAVETLDDLRMAAICAASLPVPADLMKGRNAKLARAWSAGLRT